MNRSVNKAIYLFGIAVIAVFMINSIGCPPVAPGKADPSGQDPSDHQSANESLNNDPILALEYSNYLREVVNVLEADPAFKKMIENASADDIKSGKIATHLEFVHSNVRTKLDELKRKEVERLRQLISRKAALNSLKPHEIEKLLPKHLDHQNVETFEVNDLEVLIKQATADLEEVDRIRREEFKEHEMQKEFERRQKLEQLDPETRKKLEDEYQQNIEKRKHHERINHPGSKDQLKEVWEEEDNMETDKFDPLTFFNLHDLDGNRYLDQFEIEALFQKELDKIYNTSDPLYDPAEREEEANRMREHVVNEIDKNKDDMVSLDEFLEATKQKDFEKNEEWKSIEDSTQFNQAEFENFSKAHYPHDITTTLVTPVGHQQPVQQQQHQQPQQQVPQQAQQNQVPPSQNNQFHHQP